MKMIKNTIMLGIILFFSGCGSSTIKYEKTPLDNIIQELSLEQDFSIILYDMDYDESTDLYKHKYQTIIPEKDTVTQKISDWYTVSDIFFEEHTKNMGMEIATKKNGKLIKKASPPGYNHYVGNQHYGQWRQRNGYSFWEFYGQYAFMSSIFGLGHSPIRRSYYDDYRTNYYGSHSYYGPTTNGRAYYGTSGRYNTSRTSTTWNSKPNTFKEKVRSRVKQSSTKSRTRIKRSSSRYSSSGSYRSRGGGIGK